MGEALERGLIRVLVCRAPATGFWAQTGPRAVEPDLFIRQLPRAQRVGVESDAQRLSDIKPLDGKLPSEENLRAIVLNREVAHMKTGAAAVNDGVSLTGVEDHGRPPSQGNPKACRRKMQVEASVLAEKEVAKG